MSTLLEKPIRINRILATGPEEAKAIDDPVRATILRILYNRKLTTEEITDDLKKKGHEKAATTVRHHLNVLKRAGLVEVAKIEEVKGAMMKFYSTSTKLLNFEIPETFDSDFSRIIAMTSTRMGKVMKGITEKSIVKVKKRSNGKTLEQGYVEFILMEIMNRAMTNILENNHVNNFPRN
ncbi:MAG: winged helix-turn-helix domain-containing protein [Nitrosopumilaceae archaeon]